MFVFFFDKKTKLILIISILAIIIASGFRISKIFYQKIISLEKKSNESVEEIKNIDNQIQKLTEIIAELQGKSTETLKREIAQTKTQEELLTEAVSRVAPAVVSIVITKDVPQLEVVYTNPFGDDPFFKNFGIRLPQYKQKGTEEKKVGAGTGFLVNSNGYLVTNRHVVEDTTARYTALLTDGSEKSAEVIYRDNEIDLAILKINGTNLPAVKFGNSDLLKLGQSVFAIGNALGEYSNSVSTGIVSGLKRDLEALSGNKTEKLSGVIQTDAAINPGNSGGPLVNLSGEVIGVNVAMASAENIGFSLPINDLKKIIQPYLR